jgi:hypothetical protein
MTPDTCRLILAVYYAGREALTGNKTQISLSDAKAAVKHLTDEDVQNQFGDKINAPNFAATLEQGIQRIT